MTADPTRMVEPEYITAAPEDFDGSLDDLAEWSFDMGVQWGEWNVRRALADNPGLVEVLAEVAVAHQRHRSDACLCGPLRLGSSWAEHLAAHQADAVLAWIEGQR